MRANGGAPNGPVHGASKGLSAGRERSSMPPNVGPRRAFHNRLTWRPAAKASPAEFPTASDRSALHFCTSEVENDQKQEHER